jgi:hypothetical protein
VPRRGVEAAQRVRVLAQHEVELPLDREESSLGPGLDHDPRRRAVDRPAPDHCRTARREPDVQRVVALAQAVEHERGRARRELAAAAVPVEPALQLPAPTVEHEASRRRAGDPLGPAGDAQPRRRPGDHVAARRRDEDALAGAEARLSGSAKALEPLPNGVVPRWRQTSRPVATSKPSSSPLPVPA